MDYLQRTGIKVDPQLKASITKQIAKLESKIQNYIYTLIERKQGVTNEKPGAYQERSHF
ncbi:hypothetical protein [Pseudomonas syringae]|uniref:hypothetical protein n=1 Tax=Pseudomonas syringae TaxID=317 RepID=UPI0013DE5BCD|nr:hypothetical protein [Pseudomonas syringae]UZS63107.1 hypothetical protein OQB64_02595 [Pseudomonas syringae]